MIGLIMCDNLNVNALFNVKIRRANHGDRGNETP
jgi:hypothetical protein